MQASAQKQSEQQRHAAQSRARGTRLPARLVALALAPALLLAAGCGAGTVAAGPAGQNLAIVPGATAIDTNCTGCNATSASGLPVEQFTATPAGAGGGAILWSVSGGDAASGAGSITASGQYTPPSYLTADRISVAVTARLASNPAIKATSVLAVTPGFLQPLTPENAALGPDGKLTVTGYLSQAGGGTGISFALASTPSGTAGGQGTLSATHCVRGGSAFTSCTVTYTAPSSVAAADLTYIVARAGHSSARTAVQVLLNGAGVSSNPAGHEAQLSTPVLLGSSGGNNGDYDARGDQIVDCCGGTLGSLIQDNTGRQYLLGNNHVLARSDHASVGDAIVQPGLIDNNCTPFGDGPGTTPVASLTAWLPLRSRQTNADAAIAQVNSGAVNSSGSILELGAQQANGTLAAAPPGVSSTGGKGEAASLQLRVAKSGRTTGLTCGNITALSLDVNVDYYRDCAETRPYLTKTYTSQLAISGNQFSDAGDSGALVVDAANAEPVGLLFAGGVDSSGVTQSIASPAPDVLSELSAQAGGGRQFTYVGTADHAVSCLSYGNSVVSAAQARTLSSAETDRAQQALAQARMLVSRTTGILGADMGKSSDRPGEAAVILYVDQNGNPHPPAVVNGVRTVVVPSTARAVAFGSAPQTAQDAGAVQPLAPAVIAQAVSIKQQIAMGLMRQTPAFFGVGIGQSLDNPREAALVIYVDRRHVPALLPPVINGLRTRYIFMDRLHVTRSYATPVQRRSRCMIHAQKATTDAGDLSRFFKPRGINLF